MSKILIQLEKLPHTIESLLNDQLESFKEYLNDWKKDLIQELAQEVSLQIVGESYYKWDSTCTYFPTLTFLFKEVKTSQYPRRSQIKVGLNKRNEDLTDLDINILKSKCHQKKKHSFFF